MRRMPKIELLQLEKQFLHHNEMEGNSANSDVADDVRSSTWRPNGALAVGGQAVIEGVMMRSPNRISVALRKPDNKIIIEGWQFVSLTKRNKFFALPVIRGVVNLVEMLYWGIKTLQYSAQIASGEEAKISSVGTKLLSLLSVLLALIVGVALFAYLPLLLSQLLGFRQQPIVFNLFAGAVRVVIFIAYISAISMMKDVRRLFKYHGAEHKTINAFERGEPLVVERVQRYSTHHPRCGTSFILIVAVMAIFIFAAFDTMLYIIWGIAPTPLLRLPLHLALIPIIAGISYEALKISDKLSRKSLLGKILISPGLYVQKITAKPPDDSMVEVAIGAIMDSIKDISIGEGKSKDAGGK